MEAVYVRQGNRIGSVEHYFHFLLGYLIPFLKEARNDTAYILRDCGPTLTPHLLGIPGIETSVGTREQASREINPKGYDTPELPGLPLRWIREEMPAILGATATRTDRILVVDRAKPHPFYNSRAEIKTAGSARRSVPNMREVWEAINERRPADLVTLEDMTLPEQIALFAGRRTFVAQHGAALSNLLWAPRGSRLVEITPESTRDWFRRTAELVGIERATVGQAHAHAPVDPGEILRRL
jgi:hypothetical protein